MSMTMLRFLPTIFFPASVPWLEAGTLVEVLTLCTSMTQADGSALRPPFCRKSSLRRPLSWVNTPSLAHFAKYP